ncbi:delta-1-pyrroline-5-carboxylate synthase A-like [Rosa rugosa]|uniref:delta-1-pyrroline-5-carboxylate synthase A-like n=1 Tax=Rosa rugosa TaxID=74645 RepID=UPI002B40B4B4|nr:delta-1-pyrroline-5-carboxylate synthase A-like [Rosa rugosa]
MWRVSTVGLPSDTNSELIHSYIHKGEASRRSHLWSKIKSGTRGMAAKVKAAVDAASAGIPVFVTRCSSRLDGENGQIGEGVRRTSTCQEFCQNLAKSFNADLAW